MNRSEQALDPAAVERKIFRSYWNDGLIDITAGVGIGLVGLAWLLDLVVAALVLPLLLLPLWFTARRLITNPRVGTVSFTQDRKERMHRNLIFASITGYAVLIAVGTMYAYLRSSDIEANWMASIAGLPALVVAVAILAGRFLFDMPYRTLIYAVLAFAVAILAALFSIHPGIQFLAVGLVLATVGTVLLTKFVRAFPIGEVPNPAGNVD